VARRQNGGHAQASSAGYGQNAATAGGNPTSGSTDGAFLANTLSWQQTVSAPAPTGSATWAATAPSSDETTPFVAAAVAPNTGSSSPNGASSGHEAEAIGALDAAFASAADSEALFNSLA
jgi:hypothetical protein